MCYVSAPCFWFAASATWSPSLPAWLQVCLVLLATCSFVLHWVFAVLLRWVTVQSLFKTFSFCSVEFLLWTIFDLKNFCLRRITLMRHYTEDIFCFGIIGILDYLDFVNLPFGFWNFIFIFCPSLLDFFVVELYLWKSWIMNLLCFWTSLKPLNLSLHLHLSPVLRLVGYQTRIFLHLCNK